LQITGSYEASTIGSGCTRPWAIAPRPRHAPAWKGSPCRGRVTFRSQPSTPRGQVHPPPRPVLVPPDDRLDRAPQVVVGRSCPSAAPLDQRSQRRSYARVSQIITGLHLPKTQMRQHPRATQGMKLAIFSDIHANLEALQAVLQEISATTIDRIVCLGDVVGYNTNPNECVALLRKFDSLCVAGNHDRAVSGQITTEGFSVTATRAVAWTRRRITVDAINFLARLAATGQHPESPCRSARRAAS
jgi:hypothetical protein